MLRGAEHIGQLIPLPGNNGGMGLRPLIALEHIPNGTLRLFRTRLRRKKLRPSNRLLWHIFLCLARQCVAMAYPPQGGRNAPLVRETIQATRPDTIVQASSHLDNFLFGDQYTGDPEHGFVPIVKMIDFGRGRRQPMKDPENGDWTIGIGKNLWGAGYVMMWIALPHERGRNITYNEINEYEYTNKDGERNRVYTNAAECLRSTNAIEVPLRDLIARCMAKDYGEIPSLEEVLETCQDALYTRSPNDYNANTDVDETDEGVKRLIQECVLDGDRVQPPSGIFQMLPATNYIGAASLGLRPIPGPQQDQVNPGPEQGFTGAEGPMYLGIDPPS
ncbi:hypothetical protein F4779DRAFT_304206 [Xylariaceae sp. FL0662B]|nr:hypothetical protein F4779DRAFT_304206 [Xylariaceae sp. FL0662B]